MENANKQDIQGPPQTSEGFSFKPDLLQGLKYSGYLDPSAANKNLDANVRRQGPFAESEASVGKSLAIIIAALQRIDSDKKGPQVIIVMPTRELCLQALELTNKLGSHMSDLSVVTIYGSVGALYGLFDNDSIKLRKKHSILIATPGKLLIAIKKDYIELKCLKLLILDEADQVLGSDLKDRILRILKFVPTEVQMAIFSPKQYSEVRNLIDLCLRDPVYIEAENEVYMDMKSITHYKVNIESEEDKVNFLVKYYSKMGKPEFNMIILSF